MDKNKMEDKIIILNLSRSATQSTKKYIHNLYKANGVDLKMSDYAPVNKLENSVKDKHNIIFNDEEYFLKNKNANIIGDDPYCFMYKYLDEHLPNAKFILITRNAFKWSDSFYDFVRANGAMSSAAYNNFNKYLEGVHVFDRSLRTKSDKEHLPQVYRKHTSEVKSYFKDKNNFIHLEIDSKNLEESIAKFLGFEYNGIVFPKHDPYKVYIDQRISDTRWLLDWKFGEDDPA
jgi:uncharacterized ubiquitin-like protein YukD